MFGNPILNFSWIDPRDDSIHGVILRPRKSPTEDDMVWAVHTFDYKTDNTHRGDYCDSFRIASRIFYNRVRETQNIIEEIYQ